MDGEEEGTRDVGQVGKNEDTRIVSRLPATRLDSELTVIRAPASARLEASVSFLQGEKRLLARANKEETDETEEEEVREMPI